MTHSASLVRRREAPAKGARLIAGVLLIAGCGGDDDVDAARTETSESVGSTTRAETVETTASTDSATTESAPISPVATSPVATGSIVDSAPATDATDASPDIYSSEDGRFTVRFAGSPSEQRYEVPATEGRESIDVIAYLGEIAGGVGIASCVQTDVGGSIDVLLDEGTQGAIEQLGATLDDEREIDQQGRPGREFDATGVGGRIRGRTFVDGDAVCEVVAIISDDTGGDGLSFLDSFEFVEEAA